MRVKMLIEFDFDPETGEYTPISREVIEDDKPAKKKTKTKTKDDGSTEPIVTLDDNKIILNSRAVEALGAQWEDKISIVYSNCDGLLRPIISLGSGNKLTKSNTVACRGANRDKLAEFGTEFKLVSLDNGTFMMDGGIEIPYKEESKKKKDPKIKVVEDDSPEVLPMEATFDETGDEEIKEEFTFEL